MTITTTRPATPPLQLQDPDAFLATVPELAEVLLDLTPEDKLRHETFLLLTMSLVSHFWNGNYYGPYGTYPYRDKRQKDPHGSLYGKGEQYLGHNIAAIAVDEHFNVIDFDFNHNSLFRSSMEHAEARLMRRLFALSGLRAAWSTELDREGQKPVFGGRPDSSEAVERDRFKTHLSELTVYTTLEPCAQCAGIMALARVKEVVYLQRDPGARRVANILYNLRPYGFALPKPIIASACGMEEGTRLAKAYDYFRDIINKRGRPFYIKEGQKEEDADRSTNLTKFLCNDEAMEVFDDAAGRFGKLVECPGVDMKELRDFLKYAIEGGHRGTPH